MRDQPHTAYSCQVIGVGLTGQLVNKGGVCLSISSSDRGLCPYLGVSCESYEAFTDIVIMPTDRQLELLARGVRANAAFEQQSARDRANGFTQAACYRAHDSLDWPISPTEVAEARDIVYAREVSDSPLRVAASYHLPGMNRAKSLKRHLAEERAQRKVDYDLLTPGGWRQ